MARLTREQILAALDLTERDVEVPEWGGSVRIRTLTKAKNIALRKQAMVDGQLDTDRMEILVFVHGVIDPKFEASDAQALKEKSAAAMDRVLTAIYQGSGLLQEDAKAIHTAFPDGSS